MHLLFSDVDRTETLNLACFCCICCFLGDGPCCLRNVPLVGIAKLMWSIASLLSPETIAGRVLPPE